MSTPSNTESSAAPGGKGKATPLTRAMETIKKLRAELDGASGVQPLAVVGVGVRLPGGIVDLDGYWSALEQGQDMVRPMPERRRARFADEWATLPHRGGFLDEVLDFDAGFFGISPREARHLDPQHRLLLEVAHEALENAALPPESLTDVRTGLFVGITGQDYRDWQSGDEDAYWLTGNGHCFAAGRLAYTMGLMGPAVSVDTACSSSLVAVHLARQALRRNECDVALAGGVNLVLSPRSTRLIKQTGSLAPDGLCKTFDATANGFTRGEGCGVLVLKRLPDALRDGDRVHAVIRGSAVNQDGRSSGFTAPNVRAQVALIEDALADAGLSPADIGAVEAHGTGTALGDPIEVEALITALRRTGSGPLHLGSVKTNVGHTEAAAGVVGLIRGVLSVRHQAIPPVVHFSTLNPRIDLDGTGIEVPTRVRPWTGSTGRCLGVSSFGMSGTNAHVIVGPLTDDEAGQSAAPGPVEGFEISARDETALRALAGSLADRLAGLPDADYPAFAYTATHGRSRHAVVAGIAATDRDCAQTALRAIADGGAIPSTVEGTVIATRRVVDLPNYPWQRQRYAPEAPSAPVVATADPVALPALELTWEPVPSAAATGGALVVAGDDDELRTLVADAARAAGADVTVLTETPADDAAWTEFWAARSAPADLVLAFATTPLPTALADGAALVEAGAQLCANVASAVRGIPQGQGTAFALTRGTRQVTGADTLVPGGHGLLNGLAPVLGLEAGSAWGGVVDLPAEPTAADAAAAVSAVRAADGEDVLAVRDGAALTARLREAVSYTPDLPVRADATYLVTGGLGAIGRELVGDLLRRGARSILLLGRRAEADLPTDTARWLTETAERGVRYVTADVGDGPALAEALSVLADLPPVRGIVHGAGTIAQQPLAEVGADGFATALTGKFSGAWWLHLLSADWDLDFFVQLSSVSALWGTEGYSAYAAANGGLDAIAALRAAQGKPAVSIAFGPWELEGMADDQARRMLARMGVRGVLPAAGCASLTATGPAGAYAVASDVDWARFVEVMDSVRARPLFTPLNPNAPVAGAQSATISLLDTPQTARAQLAATHVRRMLAGILGHDDPAAVREDVGFFDLGLDSIMAVDLAKELSAAFGVPVAIGDIFGHPTITELAEEIVARVSGQSTPAVVPTRPSAPRRAPRASSEPREQVPVKQDPIAIIGMAGRFPGADSVEDLWELLSSGRDGVGPVPADRWDMAAVHDAGATITTDQGGFLTDIARFDASFFDIPAREADSLDPQQRLLLESAWHALEDAAVDPKGLKGSRTGVFVGVSNSDYSRLLEQGGLQPLDAYFATGTALNAAAGRLAYVLGLEGPALAVDTACSSSLVALHLAVRSLRSGETDQVLAGGVNVIVSPSASVAVSRAHMLSPEGRCKTFSAEANGFVRAEGCGVLVLKRLSDARRAGDTVLAVIHGSAVNSDGASSGFTAPNGKSQRSVITDALRDADLPGSAIGYLEAHGTGTSLGDPIELEAAWAVYGPDRRPGDPLYIGSVKSNIGHAESASGMAAVIKTVLALRHGKLPANLHCDTLNPHVPWRDMNIRVVDSHTPWRPSDEPRYAGVSGFGFSGTNAHVILGEAPETTRRDLPTGPVVLPLSAPDAGGLERLTQAWTRRLESDQDTPVAELAAAAGAGRGHFPYRRAVLGADREALLAALAKVEGEPGRTTAPRVAFLFSGQGSQYFGMGRELYETEPVFSEVIDACDRVLTPHLGDSLLNLMFYGEDTDLINQTRVTQPALVALELALAALWRSWGVRASAVIGHSVGEIAAAVHAGVLSLDDGLTLIAHRAGLMQGTEHGGMVSVALPLAKVEELIKDRELDVATINGPESIAVAGAPEHIATFVEDLTAMGVKARALVVSHAFHSRLMDPMLDEFTTAISGLDFGAPQIPIVANLTGALAEPGTYDPAYFAAHVRRPVRFHDGARQLAQLGVDVVLELGPDRTLINLITAAGLLPEGGGVPSQRRGGKARQVLMTAAATLYERGQDLVWAKVNPATPADAPRYPFAPAEYWTSVSPRPGTAAAAPIGNGRHWGAELRSPGLRGRAFSFQRSAEFPPYLGDHRLYGTVVTPAASHLATVLSALGGGGKPVVIEDLICPRALVIKDGERYEAQIVIDQDGESDGPATFSVQSLLDAETGAWQRHVGGRVGGREADRPAPVDRAAFQAAAERRISGPEFYTHFRELGYTLGPSFCWIDEAWIIGDEALVRYAQPQLPEPVLDYELYPGLIDSLFQSMAVFLVDDDPAEAPSLAIPFAATRLSFHGRPEVADGRVRELWGHVKVKQAEEVANGRLRVETADLHMFLDDSTSVLVADDFRIRHAPRSVLEASLRSEDGLAYQVSWQPAERSAQVGTGLRVAVLARDGSADTDRIVAALSAAGHQPAVYGDEPPSATDLVLDTRFLATERGAATAQQAALRLSATMRTASREVPYVLLGSGSAEHAEVRESLFGMLNALEAEHVDRTVVRLRLGEGWQPAELAGVLAALPHETRLVLDADGLHQARLTHLAGAEAVAEFDGAALVTGGLGALGLAVAQILAEKGCRHITLMARSAPDETARQVIDELTRDGVDVRIARGDVTDPDHCAAAVLTASATAPLQSVYHLAGVNADRAFEGLTTESYEKVFHAKAHGAEVLAAALAGQPIRNLVLFSSVSAAIGSAGQVNYAAANGYLDGLTERLRADGIPASSVNWGPWVPDAKGGMAASAAVEKAAKRIGIRPLNDAEAGGVLALVAATSAARVVAVCLDANTFAEAAAGHPRAALVAAVATPVAAKAPSGPALPKGWLRVELDKLGGVEDQEDLLRDTIRELVGQTLGSSEGIDDTSGFAELGLDSIMVIDLRTALAHAVGVELPATVAIDHPNVLAMTRFVGGLVITVERKPVAIPVKAAAPAEVSLDEFSVEELTDLSFEDLISTVREDLSQES